MIGRLTGRRRSESAQTAAPNRSTVNSEGALALLRDYEESGLGWFWATDPSGSITYISECVAQALGRTAEALIGQPFTGLFLSEQESGGETGRTLALHIAGHKQFADHNVRARIETQELWWAISGRPQFGEGGTFIGYRGNGVDVTTVLTSQRDSDRLAKFDSLTGLPNRHSMESQLESTLAAYKAGQRSCALLMLDLDRFKQINDKLGHPVGDALLRQVAERLRGVVGSDGTAGRLGGDEFQVILPDWEDRGKLGDISRRLIDLLSRPYAIGDARCIIGASVGIAVFPFDGGSAAELVSNADMALYAAKDGGRGQFRFFSADLENAAKKRKVLELDLRDALAAGQIRLAFQPLVNAKTNTVAGLEALMRWEHPDFGELPPAAFIPIAEESGLIVPLGEWALRESCRIATEWPGNASVSVNIAPAQFAHAGFITSVTQALAESQLAPERLELEFTEAIFSADEVLARQTFAELRLLGVRVALDNFGSGNSPLAYLRTAQFDKIKIDRSITQEVTQPGSRCGAIAAAIVTLAKKLNMVVTAQGIEARDELQVMRDLGVEQIQGFIYSAPQSAEEVSDALATGQWIIQPDGPTRASADRRSTYRRVGVIHEDFRYDVIMRNLSRGGAAIEGLLDVPVGTEFVLDLGEGQLIVSTVRRSEPCVQGIEFESSLVDDGAGGLVTRHRVPRHLLDAMGMPSGGSTAAVVALNTTGGLNLPKFATSETANRVGR